MTLLEQERDTYEAMWAVPAYADVSPGERMLPVFLDMLPSRSTWRADSVLDAGTGSGRGALALRQAGFGVTCCDLTRSGLVPEAQVLPFVETVLWDDVRRACGYHDWVYCCDVLEHIPLPFTMLTIQRLLDTARRGVFLSIALVPDTFGSHVGKPLHQSLQSFVEWREQLATLGTVREARDLLITGCYLVEPRRAE